MLSEERKKELLFPHEEVRKSQEELVLDVERAVKERGRLVAEAPTGLGKTVSALGPALKEALEKGLTVWFLTNRQTQHRLAVETLKLIKEKFGVDFKAADLLGKRWLCSQEVRELYAGEFHEFCKSLTERGECEFLNRTKKKNGLTLEGKRMVEELEREGIKHSGEVAGKCRQAGLCSYEISLELGKKAQAVVGDYYYVFNPFIQQTIFGKMGKNLEEAILIVDEAHNLPRRATEMLSYRLTSNLVERAMKETRKIGKEYEEEIIPGLEKIQEALEELNQFDKSLGEERLVRKEEFLEKAGKENYMGMIGELEVAAEEIRKKERRSYLGGVAAFLGAWLGEEKGFTRIIGEKAGKWGKAVCLSYECLDPSMVTKGIFERAYAAVLMSGTLKPTFMYKDILGVKGEERSYPNPFPAENKLMLIVPETTTRYSLRGEKMYGLIGEKCSEILGRIPGNCAVFFPSYKLRDEIGGRISGEKRKFWEKSEMSKEEKEELLERFKAEKDRKEGAGGVLLGVMGGSFGEGIDLPGDWLKGVVVVGVPLARPELKTKEVMRYFEEKFGKGWEYGYLYPAMSKCFQSAGRCIRSASDKGAVVFLDERFGWQNYFCCFPKEGVIVTKDFGRFLGGFFGENRKI